VRIGELGNWGIGELGNWGLMIVNGVDGMSCCGVLYYNTR